MSEIFVKILSITITNTCPGLNGTGGGVRGPGACGARGFRSGCCHGCRCSGGGGCRSCRSCRCSWVVPGTINQLRPVALGLLVIPQGSYLTLEL